MPLLLELWLFHNLNVSFNAVTLFAFVLKQFSWTNQLQRLFWKLPVPDIWRPSQRWTAKSSDRTSSWTSSFASRPTRRCRRRRRQWRKNRSKASTKRSRPRTWRSWTPVSCSLGGRRSAGCREDLESRSRSRSSVETKMEVKESSEWKFSSILNIKFADFFPHSSHLTLRSPDGAARIFSSSIFPPPSIAVPGFEPTTVELHQTGTFEGGSSDWATVLRQCC